MGGIGEGGGSDLRGGGSERGGLLGILFGEEVCTFPVGGVSGTSGTFSGGMIDADVGVAGVGVGEEAA